MEEVASRIRDDLRGARGGGLSGRDRNGRERAGLATLAQPWQTVFCTRMAHIHEDECNAPEFFTGGAKLTRARPPTPR